MARGARCRALPASRHLFSSELWVPLAFLERLRVSDGGVPLRLQDPRNRSLMLFERIATLLFGLGPAWRVTGMDVLRGLKEGAGGDVVLGHGKARTILSARSLIIVGQIALSLVMLIAGGLLVRSAVAAAGLPPGEGYTWGYYNIVSDDYFESLRLPTLRGRDFTPAEAASSGVSRVAIIDEALASRLFPDGFWFLRTGGRLFMALGVRMALGATRGDLHRQMMRESVALTAVGLGTGFVLALAVGRILSSRLYEVSATDPWAFLGATAFLALAAIVASWLPVRKALRIEPMTALRHE